MKKLFTLNDLILFAYNETEKNDIKFLTEKIKSDNKISEKFKSILRIKCFLDSLYVSPSKNVMNNVLNYSKSLSIFKTKDAGNFNLILN